MQITSSAEAFLSSPAFERALANDDGQAAKAHLAAGRPIYISDPLFPGQVVRKFPDGRKQIVAVSEKGEISVVQDI